MQAIGFRHHQQTVVKDDTAQLRGMLHQVRHLVRVEKDGAVSPAAKKSAAETAAVAKAKPATKAKAAAKAKETPKPKAKAKAARGDAPAKEKE
jgi:hypothetical protein